MKKILMFCLVLISFFVLTERVVLGLTATLTATDDSWLDQHPNWASDTKGIPHPEWGWTAAELRVGTMDPNLQLRMGHNPTKKSGTDQMGYFWNRLDQCCNGCDDAGGAE